MSIKTMTVINSNIVNYSFRCSKYYYPTIVKITKYVMVNITK